MTKDDSENLRTEYSALSQYHNSLVTFRLTLLGFFLAALGFIIGHDSLIPWHICVLGLLLTFCMYIFELRTRILFESIARRGVEIEQKKWYFQSKPPQRSFYSLQYPDKEVTNYGINLKIFGKIPIEKFPILNKVRISHSVALDFLYIGLMVFFFVALIFSVFSSLQPSQTQLSTPTAIATTITATPVATSSPTIIDTSTITATSIITDIPTIIVTATSTP
jgi:hypothetical protein